MDNLIVSKLPTRADIQNLQVELAKYEQGEPVTEHLFSNGMYCRKMIIPKDTVIIGKVHKEAHFFICAAGSMKVLWDGGCSILNAGDVLCSEAGVKRVIVTLTDVIGMNIHRTDKTDLDEIESELIEPDETAMFDSANKLRLRALEN